MAIIVNTRERLKHQIFVAPLPITKEREKFLDEITNPITGAGVKRQDYWIIEIKKVINHPSWSTISNNFTAFLHKCDKMLFSLVMIKR